MSGAKPLQLTVGCSEGLDVNRLIRGLRSAGYELADADPRAVALGVIEVTDTEE